MNFHSVSTIRLCTRCSRPKLFSCIEIEREKCNSFSIKLKSYMNQSFQTEKQDKLVIFTE